MKILHSTDILRESVIATIGFFDGVHLGHEYLLRDLRSEARCRGLKTLVVTFSNHPRLLFDPDCGLKFLTLIDEKLHLIELSYIDYCLVLPFTFELAHLSSRDFMQNLHDSFGVQAMLVGYDHHFGSDRCSGFDEYVNFGKGIGVELLRCDAFSVKDINVSSTRARKALEEGNIELVTTLLGYPYRIHGKVVHGHQVGRTIGFPTANLDIPELKILPKCGVYLVTVSTPDGKEHDGLLNIGHRPTLDNGRLSVEVYIDNFDGDLYGSLLQLQLLSFIRPEQKFASLDLLKEQLQSDLQLLKKLTKKTD